MFCYLLTKKFKNTYMKTEGGPSSCQSSEKPLFLSYTLCELVEKTNVSTTWFVKGRDGVFTFIYPGLMSSTSCEFENIPSLRLPSRQISKR